MPAGDHRPLRGRAHRGLSGSGARRRGVASGILADLLAAAHDKGATDAYLCVVTENTAARRLYEGFGFTEVSAYHNRVLA